MFCWRRSPPTKSVVRQISSLRVKTTKELITAITAARAANIKYFLLGTGANILMGDSGFRGLVIHNRASAFEFRDSILRADSGATIADLIEASRDRGLSGLEHFVGIPSSVGGAIWQNLHFLSPDRQSAVFIAEIVESARTLDAEGDIKAVDRNFFKFGYDDSILHHLEVIVLDVTFLLQPKPAAEIQNQMDENMAWRRAKQPQLDEYPSCGSVFKRIEGVGAGRLIDRAGLKGKRIGGAMISPQHANYIVNTGDAAAADVLALIKLAQREVKQQFGYILEPEISLIGE